MAKKKSGPPKKTSPKRKAAPKLRAEDPIAIPDRRVFEGIMKGFMKDLIGQGEQTPLDRAQALMYEAFDAVDPKEQVKLAKKALKLAADCADAYVLLAEHANSRKEALELYEKAVAAGERALGPEVFQTEVGNFWGLMETRPYMRAREALAGILWTMGRRDEAIAHVQDMLRLNPGDNQGVRYTLAGWLLAEDRDEELSRLLGEYDEDMAAWSYTKALVAFRKHGNTPESMKLLKTARKANNRVPAYLIGRKPMPSQPPFSYSAGSEDEAILYAGEALSGWKATPGALTWLKETEPAPKKRKVPKPKTKGPLPLIKKRLEALPQEFDVWQMDFQKFGARVEEAGQELEPWLVLISSRTNDVVLGQTMSLEMPTADFLWDTLAEAISEPMTDSDPHRPTELQVRSHEQWDELTPHLEEIGVQVQQLDELDHIDFLLDELKKAMAGEQPPSLLEMPGVKPEHVAGFYAAAASFYRKAPWRKVGYEAAIEVRCNKFESGPWYAIVMGQSGMTLGMALYDDLKMFKNLVTGTMSEEENARETVALTVTFDDEDDLPDVERDAIEEYHFEIADPGAVPTIFRKERGMSMRPPLLWELELMEGCLRAVPEFVAKDRPEDTSKHTLTVPVASGTLDLVLSWVPD